MQLRNMWIFAVVVCLSGTVANAEVADREVSPATVERLKALGRVWGKVRYFHPGMLEARLDWDKAGEEAIASTLAAADADSFRAAVNAMLAQLGDPQSRVVAAGADRKTDARLVTQHEVTLEFPEKDVALIRVNDWRGVTADANPIAADIFGGVLDQLESTPNVIVDFRRFDEPGIGFADLSAFVVPRALEPLVAALSPHDLVLPSRVQVIHSGFASERWRLDNYYAATLSKAHRRLKKSGNAPIDRFIVFVYDEHGGFVTPFANALAGQGAGTSIVEGAAPSGGLSTAVPLPGSDHSAVVSTAVLGNADGSRGPIVAAYTEAPGDPAGPDAALVAALDAVRSRFVGEPAGSASSPLLQVYDREYRDQTEPTEAQRILAAFKLWNAFEYFFPYHDLMDEDWSGALGEALPEFIRAEDSIAYAKAVSRLAAKGQDTHITIDAPGYGRFLGTHTPNIQTILVDDGSLVVKEVIDEELSRSGRVRVGDIVTHVDAEAVSERMERLRPFVPASTEGSYKLRLESRLLAGEEGSEVSVTLRREGERRPVKLTLTRDTYYYLPTLVEQAAARRDHPKMQLLDGEIAYFNIGRMKPADEEAAVSLLMGSKGAVFDMRGYPNGGHIGIAAALATEARPSARIVEPFVFQAADFSAAWKTTIQTVQPGERHFPHPVVLLVNHVGISAAEHYSMLVKSAGRDRVTIVGTPTNGANGVITDIALPGAARVTFTGMQAAWADGSRLQRRGIVPDVHAEPTVESVRAGRDAVFDVGLKVLRKRMGESQ